MISTASIDFLSVHSGVVPLTGILFDFGKYAILYDIEIVLSSYLSSPASLKEVISSNRTLLARKYVTMKRLRFSDDIGNPS